MDINSVKQEYQAVCSSAVAIEMQAIEMVEACVKLIAEVQQPGRRGVAGLVKEMMAVHLEVIAGVCSGRSTLNYSPVEEPLERVYALEPWKYGLKVCEALFAIVSNTTLHPPSFEALLSLIPQLQSEIERSKKQGAIAYPQAERLLDQLFDKAWNYLHFSSECEIPNRGFREILERWSNHPDPDLQALIERIKADFLMP